jgi:hypothetical protein
LSDLDSNQDGVIDNQDTLFNSLLIWKDANSNGVTDQDELISLGYQNITSLDLHPQTSDRTENGNQLKLISSYTTSDGLTHEMADVWLSTVFDSGIVSQTNAVTPSFLVSGWMGLSDVASFNDGSEMFGEATRLSNGGLASNGFEALIDLDFNLDGVLDLNDPLFSYLQIWKDANSDGITDLGELFSLVDQNITSFDVHPKEVNRAENGNQIKLISTYSTGDGMQHEIADVWLKVDFNPDVPTPIIG